MLTRHHGIISLFAIAVFNPLNSHPCRADESFDLDAHKKSVKEWQDLKYGLFVCWGPASLTNTGIGWNRNAPRSGNPNSWYPPKDRLIDGDVYDNLYKQFDPVDVDANEWVRMAKKAGVRYFVFLTKHCDGFMMWDTKTSDYNIMNTPYGKDICKELADACHQQGMKLGWYYAPCDWVDPDCRSKTTHDVYLNRMKEQLRELMTNYGKVSMLWTDTDGGNAPWDQDNTYAMIRGLQPGIMINNRMEYNRIPGWGYGGWADSYRKRMKGQPTNWKDFGDYDAAAENHVGGYNSLPHESTLSMPELWTWRSNAKLRSATEGSNLLIRSLIGNGNLLYNVAPMPSGEIEGRQRERLLMTGKWLEQVGEAVYDTVAGPILGGRWGGTTSIGKHVYLFLPDDMVNDWDQEEPYPLTPLDKKLVSTTSLTGDNVSATQNSDGTILVTLPEATLTRKEGQADFVIVKLTFNEANPQIKEGITISQANLVKQSKVRPGRNIAFIGAASMIPGPAWNHLPQHATDGNSGTIAQAATPVWDFKVDLHKAYPIDKITILPTPNVWANEYSIKISIDNDNWTTLHTAANAQDQLTTIEFDKIDARYVWMDVTGVGHKGNYGHSINEFEIFLASDHSMVKDNGEHE